MADFMRGNIIMSSSRVVLIAPKHDDVRWADFTIKPCFKNINCKFYCRQIPN